MTMMSKFLKHERCPDCEQQGKDRSGNNLGVWDDGSQWCFSCGYHKVAKKDNDYVRQKLTTDASKIGTSNPVNLPADASHDIALEGVQWIRKYDLTIAEIRQHNFRWSPSRKMLIMPVFHKDTHVLLYWQGKHFTESLAAKTKYQTFGYPHQNIEEIGDRSTDTIVLVEDKISAIKVARVGTAMPLYGSELNLTQAMMLANKYKECIIWLDRDKLSHSMDMKDWMHVYFTDVRIVSTELDPKEYDEQNILNAITPSAKQRENDWKDAIKLLNRKKQEELIHDDEVDLRYRKWDGRS